MSTPRQVLSELCFRPVQTRLDCVAESGHRAAQAASPSSQAIEHDGLHHRTHRRRQPRQGCASVAEPTPSRTRSSALGSPPAGRRRPPQEGAPAPRGRPRSREMSRRIAMPHSHAATSPSPRHRSAPLPQRHEGVSEEHPQPRPGCCTRQVRRAASHGRLVPVRRAHASHPGPPQPRQPTAAGSSLLRHGLHTKDCRTAEPKRFPSTRRVQTADTVDIQAPTSVVATAPRAHPPISHGTSKATQTRFQHVSTDDRCLRQRVLQRMQPTGTPRRGSVVGEAPQHQGEPDDQFLDARTARPPTDRGDQPRFRSRERRSQPTTTHYLPRPWSCTAQTAPPTREQLASSGSPKVRASPAAASWALQRRRPTWTT